jgi:ribosomal-protein-alanine N-acetyltransferase
MTISLLTIGDLDAASELHAACFPNPWPPEGFAALLSTGAFGFKAADKDKIRGLIMGRCAADECDILTFAVLPAFRRQGIGTALLAWLMGSLDANRTGSIYLEAEKGNDHAISLYTKAGFDPVGARAGYYTAGDKVQDAIIMRRIVPQ